MTDNPEKLYTLQLTKPEITAIAAAMTVAVHFILPNDLSPASATVFKRAMVVTIASASESLSLVEKFKAVMGDDA